MCLPECVVIDVVGGISPLYSTADYAMMRGGSSLQAIRGGSSLQAIRGGSSLEAEAL